VLRLFLMVFAFIAAPVALAQSKVKNPFRVETQDVGLALGAAGVVRITVAVPADHHLYRDMMSVTVLDDGGLVAAEPSFPPGHQKPDPADPETNREQYDMDVIIEVPVTASGTAGEYLLKFAVKYQGCKKSLCWMPQTDEVQATVKVGG
jgi:hypothetical protein